VRRDAVPPAGYSADAWRCRGRDVPRSPATAAVRGPAPAKRRVLGGPTPKASDGRGWPQEPHLGRANGACRAGDEQRPRLVASVVTRAGRCARSQATTGAQTSRSRAETGFAQATRGQRLRLSDRRHARRPAPVPRQAPETRAGHRPPRRHQQCPRAGGPRPTPFRNRVSQPVLDGSARNVPRVSRFAAMPTRFVQRSCGGSANKNALTCAAVLGGEVMDTSDCQQSADHHQHNEPYRARVCEEPPSPLNTSRRSELREGRARGSSSGGTSSDLQAPQRKARIGCSSIAFGATPVWP